MLRATFKSLLSRKLRLTLAVIAVVLGVGFVSGAYVMTDSLGARFEKLFTSVNENVDVQVQAKNTEDAETPPLLTEQDLDRIKDVDGVDAVSGDVDAMGVVPFKKDDGKPLQSQGAPNLGFGVDGKDDPFALIHVADGRWPQRAGEVAITRYTAEQTGVKTGDRMKVYLPNTYEAKEYQVVGILAYSGDRATLGGETVVAFHITEAQRLFYGKEGRYSGVVISADDGVSQQQLADRISQVLPTTFEAKTAAEVNEEGANEIKEGLQFITWFFLAFGLVALFVGIFLIFNTFNIIVAQRARELALFRAMGASRRQVTTAVIVEATVVGVVGSTLGLALGAGLGAAANWAMSTLLNLQLPDGGIVIAARTILLAYAVGMIVTLVAALVPALRASSVPPLAAMRDVARPDKPLRWRAIIGVALTAPGAVLIWLALDGRISSPLQWLGLGVFLALLGVTLLSPLLTRPLAGLVGVVLSWGTASKLGRRNALRNPRRTAVTAATLMIGVTLVSGVSVLGASFKKSTEDLVTQSLGADVMISTALQQAPDGKQGFDPKALDKVREIPGVTDALPLHASVATVDGKTNQFVMAMDLSRGADTLAMKATKGEVTSVGAGEAVVDKSTATSNKWNVGAMVSVKLAKGGERDYRLVGIYESKLVAGLALPESEARYFAGPLAFQGYVQTEDGADTKKIADEVESIMSEYPMVTVGDQAEYIEQTNGTIDIALTILYVLLALAVFIAVLGIINTLVLSVYERTRELGMLRAIGMARKHLKRMIRVEAIILAVFGCLLGIGLGVALGAAISQALITQDIMSTIAFPTMSLVVFVVAAVIAGVLAAWWPAFRASRLNVLEAISYE